MSILTTMQQLAKRAADDKFEEYTKVEKEVKTCLETIWEEWKPKFEAYDNADGQNIFKFRFALPEELESASQDVVNAAFLSLNDFAGNPTGVQVFKWSNTDPHSGEQGGEGNFTLEIRFGYLANKMYDELKEEHQKKRRRTSSGEHTLEEELMKPEEEEAMIKAEQDAPPFANLASQQPQSSEQLSGFPDDGNPANAEFEELLQNGVIQFTAGVYVPTNQVEQVIEPGPRGRRNDIFENKDLFKRVTPRFFFNGDHKQWRRNAPEGWTAPGVVAEAHA